MLARFIENKAVIFAFSEMHVGYPKFSRYDFDCMEKIVHALNPLKEATVMLQARDVSVSSILPTIYCLKRMLESKGDEISLAILGELQKPLQGKKDGFVEMETQSLLLVSTILDPRFKLDFIETTNHTLAKCFLRGEAEEISVKTASEEAKETEKPSTQAKTLSALPTFFEQYRPQQDASTAVPVDVQNKIACVSLVIA